MCIRDRLEILGGVDRDKIDELLTAASHDVEARGFEPRIARVVELIDGHKGAAEAALMLGLAIALADDDVSAEEREVANQLSSALGLGLLTLDSLIADIRG